VNFKDDAEYRKRLARGFLNEAHLNLEHQLWRSCVDNSQLSIENSGKMIIALFDPVEKSHNPSHHLKRFVEQKRLGDVLQPQIAEIIPILEHFGTEEHFMTDYGDETTRTDPWSLFKEEDAREALEMAERCYRLAEEIYVNYLKEPTEESGS
jgi:HEPN domain-containing protein